MITVNTVRRLSMDVGAPLIAAAILISGMVAGGSAIASPQPDDGQFTGISSHG